MYGSIDSDEGQWPRSGGCGAIGVPLRPAEEERTAGESEAGAGGASAKDTERAAGVFMAAVRVAAAILIRMGGLCGGPSVNRRGQYLYWRRRQLSRAKVTIMARGLHHGVVRSKLAEASELDDDVTRWLG